MKNLTFITFSILLTGLASCQNKPVKTISELPQMDTLTIPNETKIYILQKEKENSDFNYSKLDDIDGNNFKTINIENLMPVFEPVNGQYKYYQFLSTFVGEAYNSGGPRLFKEFHDILIIKTDKENKIIDAYQYTLEWGELPLQYDVFKSSVNNISLTNNMDINKLKFIRTYGWNNDKKELKESGTIKLK
ncbi:MAG: hypothetical protein Q8M15_06145 [Bacteroidota bacterium]|nr:hypothetical protein [Bacteroidota bacterium]